MLMLSLVSGIRKIRKGSVYFATAPLQLTASCNGSMAQIYNAMLLGIIWFGEKKTKDLNS